MGLVDCAGYLNEVKYPKLQPLELKGWGLERSRPGRPELTG